MQRGASMTTDKHVDPSVAPQIIEEENQESPDADIPEGALRFNLTADEIKEAMIEASTEVRLLIYRSPNLGFSKNPFWNTC